MMHFFHHSFPLTLVLLILLVAAPISRAQDAPSTQEVSILTPDALEELLPEPPSGYELTAIGSYEKMGEPHAEAQYVRIDGGERFGVAITRIGEARQKQLRQLPVSAPMGYEVAEEPYRGGTLYTVVVAKEGEQSLLFPFGAFLVSAEGNAPVGDMRIALEAVDIDALPAPSARAEHGPAQAQDVSSRTAKVEALERLLPEPPSGFERTAVHSRWGTDGPKAQAMYLRSQDEGFEFEIEPLGEAEREELLQQLEAGLPGFDVTSETYRGYTRYGVTATEEEKSVLILLVGPFQVYMEGNVALGDMTTTLDALNLSELQRLGEHSSAP